MIPKIIHYCWLSGEEYPRDIKNNITSWKAMLPDYEFMLWDTNRFDISRKIWTQQAFEKSKFAFASDFIRLHAVYTHGGIYLDTDVEVLKSFNDLLHLPYFIGAQHDNLIEAAIFGSEKKSSWILKCLQYYNERPFIKKNGNYDTQILPLVMKSQLRGMRNITIMKDSQPQNAESVLKNQGCLYLFPFEYFSTKNIQSGKISKTKNTYTIHHFNSAWMPAFSHFRRKLKKAIGVKTVNRMISFFRLKKFLKYLYSKENKWDSK